MIVSVLGIFLLMLLTGFPVSFSAALSSLICFTFLTFHP